MDYYRPIIQEAVKTHNNEQRAIADRDLYSQAFLQTINLWRKDEEVKNFTLAKRFAKIACQLLEVDNVRIYLDQALYKEPGGRFTPWHQDQYYWPLDTNKTVTMWMPLVDLDASMGILEFASGSHKDGFLEQMAISDESEKFYEEFVKNRGYELSKSKTATRGDASFHYGWTLHHATENNSDILRQVMTVVYVADGARVIPPDNQNRKDNIDLFLPRLKAGDLVNTEMNPKVL